MNSFIDSIQNYTTTANGGTAYKSTLSACLDLFSQAGLRQHSDTALDDLYAKAYVENPRLAFLVLLWSRGIFSGAGIKQLFRTKMLLYPNIVVAMIKDGEASWKDFFVLFEEALKTKNDIKKVYTDIIHKEIKTQSDRLFFKWFPRRGLIWDYCYKPYGAKNLRKIIVGNTQVVETQMSKKAWNEINYQFVPGQAMRRYSKKAFPLHDFFRFTEFINNKNTHVNSKTLYPHDVLEMLKHNSALAQKAWEDLPNFVENGASFLPVVDVSGSMCTSCAGTKTELITIAQSLGIYLAERNKSVFKDKLLIFSRNATWIDLTHSGSSLSDKYEYLNKYSEVANTDFEQVFKLILDTCVANKVPQEDLPTHLLCLTDGQFDRMSYNNGDTVFETAKINFARHGYVLPKVVFWNLSADYPRTQPITKNTTNALLVSGYSANLLNTVLSDKNYSPVENMYEIVKKFEQYII